MVDSSARELLGEISKKHKMLRYHRWFLFLCFAAFFGGIAGAIPLLFAPALPAAILGTPFLWILDRRRKAVNLYYDLDADYAHHYRALLEAFDRFGTSRKVWLIETEAEVLNKKYHAGANLSMERKSVDPRYALPPHFTSNVKPPMIPAGRQTLYLLPDFVLVFDGWKVGAVGYRNLITDATQVGFIESESVPRDSRQVGQTWRFVNKKGGPDRRFKNNRQLPIMAYGQLNLRSATGLNEQFQTSNPEAVGVLAAALSGMASVNASPALPAELL